MNTLEFILVTSAYLALIASFAGIEQTALLQSRLVSELVLENQQAAEGCMIAELFHLDAIDTALNLGNTNFTASGKTIGYGNATAECRVEVGGGENLIVRERGMNYE